VKSKIAERNSKFHKAGDEYLILDTMTTKTFRQMLLSDVIPAIIKKVGQWADRVVVQMDSAGGHSAKKTAVMLTDYGQEIIVPVEGRLGTTRTITIEFIPQPTRSPDLNVLDLGAWYSLQSVVEECKYEAEATKKLTHRVIDEVLKAWSRWESAEKLTALFKTLEKVVAQVVKHEGGNQFDIRG